MLAQRTRFLRGRIAEFARGGCAFETFAASSGLAMASGAFGVAVMAFVGTKLSMSNQPEPTTIKALDAYFRRQTKGRVFSISHALDEVRQELPDTRLSDTELADLLAGHAVALGFTPISFDLRAIRHRIELAVMCEIAGFPLPRPAPQRGSGLQPETTPSIAQDLHDAGKGSAAVS